jgi:hypothetical protein
MGLKVREFVSEFIYIPCLMFGSTGVYVDTNLYNAIDHFGDDRLESPAAKSVPG